VIERRLSQVESISSGSEERVSESYGLGLYTPSRHVTRGEKETLEAKSKPKDFGDPLKGPRGGGAEVI
jgi:hypothetical protein